MSGRVEIMEQVSERYRRLSRAMSQKIADVPDDAWDNQTPCDDWRARDLVAHLVDGHGRMQSLVGRSLVPHPDVGDDPVGAWEAVRRQMQEDLDDPVKVEEEYDGRMGSSTFGKGIDSFICFDLVVHGWDLARATGQDETLDPQDVEGMRGMVEAMGEVMRSNGVIKGPVEPAPDASAQDRLLAALGRQV